MFSQAETLLRLGLKRYYRHGNFITLVLSTGHHTLDRRLNKTVARSVTVLFGKEKNLDQIAYKKGLKPLSSLKI